MTPFTQRVMVKIDQLLERGFTPENAEFFAWYLVSAEVKRGVDNRVEVTTMSEVAVPPSNTSNQEKETKE